MPFQGLEKKIRPGAEPGRRNTELLFTGWLKKSFHFDKPASGRIAVKAINHLGPAEAMEKVNHHSDSIDLLMTDVVIPERNGRDLAIKITPLYWISGFCSCPVFSKRCRRVKIRQQYSWGKKS